MEIKSAEIEIARDSFYSWDNHTGVGIEISILEISGEHLVGACKLAQL
jgi:hypothetical protein